MIRQFRPEWERELQARIQAIDSGTAKGVREAEASLQK